MKKKTKERLDFMDIRNYSAWVINLGGNKVIYLKMGVHINSCLQYKEVKE